MQSGFAYHFSRHARNRMRMWRLTPDQVIAVVESPARATIDEDGYWMVWEGHTEPTIRVTYTVEESTIVIISAVIVGMQHRPPR